MDKKPLTIVELTARNVLNLRAVRITPDKKVVVLTGKNGAGKSNILDIIQALLEGLKLKMPILSGEEKAVATLDLGSIKIRKRWTPKGEALEVFEILPDGNKRSFSSPQTFLNELTGKMVDPMKLLLMLNDDKKKFHETLSKLVGLDFADLKEEESLVREERKKVNDRIRAAIAQLKEMTAPAPETPDEEITFKEKLNNLNRLREKRAIFEKVSDGKRRLIDLVEAKNKNRELMEKEIEEIKKKIVMETQEIDDIKTKIEAIVFPDEISASQILDAEKEIETLEETNAKIRHAIRYRRAVKEAEKYKDESEKLTQKLERIEQDKQTRVAQCTFPVEGLSLTEDEVFYNGKPIDVASDGQKIIIFTKMAMALSPDIKVLVIRDGSLLDSDNFRAICSLAESEGYEIWVEKVDESGQIGIFIENGEIISFDGVEVKKADQPRDEEGEE